MPHQSNTQQSNSIPTVRSFQDLIVWQRAIDLSVSVYSLTQAFPQEELFGLTSQLRRASVSVSSNIAEGQARNSTKEFIQFLSIARGSNAEVRSQLYLIQRLGLANATETKHCLSLTVEISKMLASLIATLK